MMSFDSFFRLWENGSTKMIGKKRVGMIQKIFRDFISKIRSDFHGNFSIKPFDNHTKNGLNHHKQNNRSQLFSDFWIEKLRISCNGCNLTIHFWNKNGQSSTNKEKKGIDEKTRLLRYGFFSKKFKNLKDWYGFGWLFFILCCHSSFQIKDKNSYADFKSSSRHQ